ncbi:serine/threonine protein kinase [Asticcacaulis excentricus]|uniref:Serine/threonine protein kinase n=1 Tax=Asticcacaulis excentricus (strain ATCC 15261 / DSM 4724 / KCTC 12464 / NCIMB 9791 / VKM B-1370 / CB 48) TaxID=573065 RepID=E8RW02_ASTEC|nr:protein kinase [Asticcacaulis excentricus]ADU15424.1 serine/threonine protein kinase [Asticcacaulis excentricus CB 48]
MSSFVFFDPEELRKGQYFEIDDELITEEGRTYIVGEWLARGGNASVFKCIERSSGNEYAVKFLMQRGERSRNRFFKEARLLKELRHDHIIEYRGTGRAGAANRSARLPFIIMEIAEGNLSNIVKGSNVPSEVYVGQFRGLARGLAELHAKAIHRDIKPENILISGDRWLLSDYGLCKYSQAKDVDMTPADQVLGPKFWLSPEAHNRRIGQSDAICEASDVFQLAAVFWYVVTGRHPSGLLCQEDWTGPDWLFDPLVMALQHKSARRPVNGKAFAASLDEAIGC